MTPNTASIHKLQQQRPRNTFVTASLWGFLSLIVFAWTYTAWTEWPLFTSKNSQNVRRFLREARPYDTDAREKVHSLSGLARWVWNLLTEGEGFLAAAQTLAIAVAAIVLAGVGGVLCTLPAARNFASPEPYAPTGSTPSLIQILFWRSVNGITRAILIFLRGVPEYVWAFFFVGLLHTYDPHRGVSAWPAVLALAVHNVGIIGKLNAEVVENADPTTQKALRMLGARRPQIAIFALTPALLPRFLLYFFYRWETCVREATVLGMLGVVSLGYFIGEARARNAYDQMLFYTMLGALLILIGDFVSNRIRQWVRNAS